MDLVGPTPVGNGVEVIGQRGVTEELGLFVLGVFGEGEGVVRGDAAADEEGGVADVLTELGFGGGGGRGEW